MRISLKPLLYFFVISIPALLVIAAIVSSYKHIMSALPLFLELDIQFYYAFLLFLFLYNLIFFWKFNFFNKLKAGPSRTIFIPSFLFLIPLMIGFGYIRFFASSQYKDVNFIKDLHEAGIISQDFIAIPILIGIFIVYALFFLWLILKKNYSAGKGILYFIFLLSTILLLAFHYGYLNTYDYSYLAGPVNDVLHGKFLLLNAPSQYGFFSILFLSAIFRIIPLGLANIVLVNAVLVTLQFIFLGVALSFILRNKWLALLAVVTAIFANYIIEIYPPGTFPQTNAWRFGNWVVILILLLLRERAGERIRKIAKVAIPGLIGFFIFWQFDSGLYLLFAYLCFVLVTNMESSFSRTMSKILPPVLEVIFSTLLIFIAINFFYVVFLGKFPNWAMYIADPGYYLSSGFSFVPLSGSLWHKIIFATYFINFLYIATKVKYYPDFVKDYRNKLFISTLFLGVFQLTYYMGRSHLNNLHHIILPFIVCLFYDFDRFLQFLKNQRSIFTKVLGLSNMAIFLVLPTYFFLTQGAINFSTSNFFIAVRNVINRKQLEEGTIKGILGNAPDTIKEKYGEYIKQQRIALVSWEDVWYLIELNMKNNIDSNNLKYFIREDELHALSQQIIDKKYKYVFIDYGRREGFVSINQASVIYKDLQPYYKVVGTIDNHLEILGPRD